MNVFVSAVFADLHKQLRPFYSEPAQPESALMSAAMTSGPGCGIAGRTVVWPTFGNLAAGAAKSP